MRSLSGFNLRRTCCHRTSWEFPCLANAISSSISTKDPFLRNILLADEINRASPRTQSALLEAMGENQVSVDGVRRDLAELFFVIATQNPVEFRGTYPLPEAQMDRFAMQFSLGYVDSLEEVAILSAQERRHPLEGLASCVSMRDVLALQKRRTRCASARN